MKLLRNDPQLSRVRQTQQFKANETIRPPNSWEHFILRTHHNDSTFLLENFCYCGFLKSGLYCNFSAKRKENFWDTWHLLEENFCPPHFWTDAGIVGWLTSWGYWDGSRAGWKLFWVIFPKKFVVRLSCFLWESLKHWEFNLKRRNFEFDL